MTSESTCRHWRPTFYLGWSYNENIPATVQKLIKTYLLDYTQVIWWRNSEDWDEKF